MRKTRPRSRGLAAFVLFGALVANIVAADVLAADPPAYRWRNVAIGGGGFITGLVFHPTQKGVIFARTDIGGAYRWNAGEGRWQPLLDWMPDADKGRFGVESIAVDPSDASTLYIAAGTYLNDRGSDGAILRSTDGGSHFERASLPFKLGGNEQGRGNGERLAVDPNDGRVLLFGSRANGLWRSGDSGVSWTEVTTFPAVSKSASAGVKSWNGLQPVGIAFVAFDPASGGNGKASRTLYAGVSTRETSLFRSLDGGASWQAVPGQPTGLRPNHMVRDPRGRLLLSYGDEPGPNTMNNGALWRFDPADGSWIDISPLAQSTDRQGDGFGWGAVSVDATNPEVIVATTFNRFSPGDEVMRSVDGGKSWKPMLAGSQYDRSNAPWTADSSPHWMGDVEIDPQDPDRVWFVTGYGAWASRNARAFDGGAPAQWEFPMRGLEETVPLALLSPPQGPHLVSGLGDIDGFVHDDLDSGQARFTGVRFSNTESLAMAGQQPLTMVRTGHFHDRPAGAVRAAWSRDGGRSWTAFASEPPDGEGAGRITIAADGTRVIWQPRKGGHWITADVGGHWQAVQGLPSTAVVEADGVQAALYYAYDASTGKLYISGDGGVAFAEARGSTGAVGDWFRAELRPDPRGGVWIAAAWRGLLHWTPGKLERVAGVDNVTSLGLGAPVKAGDAPVLFVYGKVGGTPGLHRSDDGGKRWRRIDDDAHRFAGMIRHVTGDPRLPGRVYFGTEGRGIWYGDPQ